MCVPFAILVLSERAFSARLVAQAECLPEEEGGGKGGGKGGGEGGGADSLRLSSLTTQTKRASTETIGSFLQVHGEKPTFKISRLFELFSDKN